MGHHHSSTVTQRIEWVSELLAKSGSYGVISRLSHTLGVSRQTLYSWKAKGQAALQGALAPAKERLAGEGLRLERAIVTLLVEGHASYRGIQRCLRELLGQHVSLGRIAAVAQEAGARALQWLNDHLPATARGLALDEMYGSQRGEAYLSVVDVGSGAVWASTSPVAVDGESWTLLLWELEEQGLHWHTTVSDGGRAIGEAVSSVSPERPHQRDVWHILHSCQHVQARLDRVVERLKAQSAVVARQAARLAAGKRPLGRCPKSDVSAHAAQLAQAQYVANSLGYLSSQLHRLLDVVVLAEQPMQGVLSSRVRQEELETVLALLEELRHVAPSGQEVELTRLVTLLRAALPQLVLFTPGLDGLQAVASQELGASALHLLGWAWQRRAILGPSRQALLAALPADWRPVAAPLFKAWEEAVRASSAVENWHSILRPYLAVHRRLSTGMLALVAFWHNHRIAERGLYQGQSPLMRSGLTELGSDWLLTLGYPPHEATRLPFTDTACPPLRARAA
jgi:hypothetical protein